MKIKNQKNKKDKIAYMIKLLNKIKCFLNFINKFQIQLFQHNNKILKISNNNNNYNNNNISPHILIQLQ